MPMAAFAVLASCARVMNQWSVPTALARPGVHVQHELQHANEAHGRHRAASGLESVSLDQAQLKIIAAGQSTTSTHWLQDTFCFYGLTTWHDQMICEPKRSNKKKKMPRRKLKRKPPPQRLLRKRLLRRRQRLRKNQLLRRRLVRRQQLRNSLHVI